MPNRKFSRAGPVVQQQRPSPKHDAAETPLGSTCYPVSPKSGRRRIPPDSKTQPLLVIDEVEATNEASIDAVVHPPTRGALSPTTTGHGVKHDHQRATLKLPGRPTFSRVSEKSSPPSTVSTDLASRSSLKTRSKEPNEEAQFFASRVENIHSNDKAGDWQSAPGRGSLDAAPTTTKRERTMPTMPMSLVAPWARRPAPLGTPHHRLTTQQLPTTAVDGDSTVTSQPAVPVPPPPRSANTTNLGFLEPNPKKQQPTPSSKPLFQRRKASAKLLSPSQRLQQAINLRCQTLASATQKENIDRAQQPVSMSPPTPEPTSAAGSTSGPRPRPRPSRQVTSKCVVGQVWEQCPGEDDEVSDGDVLGAQDYLCGSGGR